MRMKRATWGLALLMGLIAACKSRDNTGIVVEVWSDLAIPNQLSAVRIEVADTKGTSSETFTLTSRSQLPVHLALVPGGEKAAALTIKAVGLSGGVDIVWQAADVAFVPGARKLLRLVLESRCAGAGCSTAQSCAAGVCVSVPTISQLPGYDPKAPPVEPDAGTRGSTDAGDDVAATDATQAEPGKDATAERIPDDARSDAPAGSGGTGGDAAGTSSTGGMGGNTTGGAGGTAGGVAGSSGASLAGSGGAGGGSVAGGIGGTSLMGGRSSSGTVVLPPDAGLPADAPMGGAAGGASGGASATAGSGGAGGTGGNSASAVVDCGPLSKPNNGTVDVTATTYNSTASYSCTTAGYVLLGDDVRTCQATGLWSGNAPTCVLAYGGTCSTTPNCPPESVCCNGSVPKCDTTRLPAGDGTNPGQYAISTDNEMITDTITGLVWQRDVSGERPGCSLSRSCTWLEASAYCDGLTLGGFTDWRLPAMTELRTIVDFTRASPAIDLSMFPDTPSEWFWTSTVYAGSSGRAWAIGFSDGFLGDATAISPFRVRCVR